VSVVTDLQAYRALPRLRAACKARKLETLRYWRRMVREATSSAWRRAHADRLSRERAKKPHEFRKYVLDDASRNVRDAWPDAVRSAAKARGFSGELRYVRELRVIASVDCLSISVAR
jgi:predicted transcriptional regulator